MAWAAEKVKSLKIVCMTGPIVARGPGGSQARGTVCSRMPNAEKAPIRPSFFRGPNPGDRLMSLQRTPRLLVLLLALAGFVPALALAQEEPPPKAEESPRSEQKAPRVTGVDKTQVPRGGIVV